MRRTVIYLDPSTHTRALQQAEADERSLSQWIGRLIASQLDAKPSRTSTKGVSSLQSILNQPNN